MPARLISETRRAEINDTALAPHADQSVRPVSTNANSKPPSQPEINFPSHSKQRKFDRDSMGAYIIDKSHLPLSSLSQPTPSPQDYYPKIKRDGPEWSILGRYAEHNLSDERREAIENMHGPGPAKYNLRESQLAKNQATDTFGRRCWEGGWEVRQKQSAPGPLTYDISHGNISEVKGGFTLSGRFGTKIEEGPSPNKYLQPSSIGGGPKFSMGHRGEEKRPNNYFNPDARLESLSKYQTAPHCKLRPVSSSPHNRLDDMINIKETMTHAPPNLYYPLPEVATKTATLKGRFKDLKFSKTPGPANYVISAQGCIGSGGPVAVLTGRGEYDDWETENEDDRNNGNTKKNNSNPGPAEYDVDMNHLTKNVFKAAPAFSLGSRTKILSNKDSSCGPASYAPQSTMKKCHGPVLISRPKDISDKDALLLPGPANYSLPSSFDQRRTQTARQAIPAIEKSPRESMIPGPADYSPQPEKLSTQKSGTNILLMGRWKTRVEEPTAGPGGDLCPDEKPLKQSSLTKGVSFKGRPSPCVLVFPSNRLNTLNN